MVNVNKEQTQNKFGYSVDSLTKGSHKKVICSCSYCGNPVEVPYKNVVKKIENNQNVFCNNKCSGEFCRNNPEFKEKVKNANRPNEEARREKIKNSWTDDKRKEHSEHIKEILTEDLIKQRAESLRKHYEDETNKERLRINAAKNWEDSEYREAIIKFQKERWNDNLKKNQSVINKKWWPTVKKERKVEMKKKAKETMVEKYGTTSSWTISRKNGTITTEENIRTWLNSLGFNFKEALIPNDTKQLDGLDEEKKVAFEYCGLYWHNEKSPQPRNRSYHHHKLKACNGSNIRLFTIFEDEWLQREAQVKGFLKAALGKCSRRFVARKLKVKLIDTKTAQDFYEAYHIQGGKISATYSAGLFNEDELIGAMSFGKHHRNNKEFVLNRLCFRNDCYVVGGASRLFKFLLDESKYETIISWSDNRWSEGGVYESLGFTMEENMKPDYSYVDSRTYDRRIPKQSQQKRSTNCPEGKTEKEWADERGLYRIWDCGKVRWKYEKIPK